MVRWISTGKGISFSTMVLTRIQTLDGRAALCTISLQGVGCSRVNGLGRAERPSLPSSLHTRAQMVHSKSVSITSKDDWLVSVHPESHTPQVTNVLAKSSHSANTHTCQRVKYLTSAKQAAVRTRSPPFSEFRCQRWIASYWRGTYFQQKKGTKW